MTTRLSKLQAIVLDTFGENILSVNDALNE